MMTKSAFICVFILITTFISSAQKGIEFRDLNWQEAFEASKSESKLIFLEAYTDWSQPCEILEKYTFADRQVGDFFNEQFINIRLDMEDMPGVILAEEYMITSFPALLFLDSVGNVIHRGCGAIATDELIALGEVALTDDNLSMLHRRFEQGERGNDFLIDYSLLLAEACMGTSGLVDKYFDDLSEEEWTSETTWNMINLNASEPFDQSFQYLMQHKETFATKFGKDTVDQKIYNTLLDVTIGIYEEADLRLFATQALQQLMGSVDFEGKNELVSLTNLKAADLKENWPVYAENAVKVVDEQEVTDPDQLNEFAWKFYLFIDDQTHLAAAAGWMRSTLDTYPNATYYDSYASLLYKLGKTKEAVKYSERALQAAEIEMEDLMHYENQLNKFKAGR